MKVKTSTSVPKTVSSPVSSTHESSLRHDDRAQNHKLRRHETLKANSRSQNWQKMRRVHVPYLKHDLCCFCSEHDMAIPYLKGAARHVYKFPTKEKRTTTSSSPHFFLTFFLTYLLTFFLTYLFNILSVEDRQQHWTHGIAVEVRHATLISHDRGWGPARNTELTGSQLRSGAQHWPHRIAVEVRHATLNSRDRSWGPARNTDLTGSRLRSGTQHWTHTIAVEVRHATLISQDRGWGPARNTELTGSQLRSGTQHWSHIIVVEVRHATLLSQDRGWDLARRRRSRRTRTRRTTRRTGKLT